MNEELETVEQPIELAQENEGQEAVSALFEQVKTELAQVQDRYLRLGADFENYKKRAERDRQTAVRFASESILHDLLPVMDHLEQAVVAAQSTGGSGAFDTVVMGVKMVLKQFEDVLGRYGVVNFSALGQTFDPQKHEAVSQIEDATVPEGHVIQEFQKGYMLHERLIRPARVVVSKLPLAAE